MKNSSDDRFSMATHTAHKICDLLLLLSILSVSVNSQGDHIVNTINGKIRGKRLSVLGGEIRAFLGIPYGKPPLGKLRFRPPEPAERWEGVFDATNYANSCYQIPDTLFPGFRGAEMWNPNTKLSEDCLYLNVWTPFNKASQSSLAPVLVWIYGGGFISGTSSLDIYDGRYLSKVEGVVVVSMNYRLGALGFLALSDNNIRGNAGLLDQRLALQWVSNNIVNFGGDPSQVTLFGESAGSASVGFHLLSPGSHDLFQRAVMQSGSPNALWASVSKEVAQERSMRLAKLIGCPTSSPAHLDICLQRTDASVITSKQFDTLTQPTVLPNPFPPVVDGYFLPDEVEVLLQSHNLPKKDVLFGLNQNEGTYFLVYGMPGFNITGESLITRMEFIEGVQLAMADLDAVARKGAIFHYTDWTDEHNRMKNRDSLGNLVGDRFFVCPLLEFAHRYSQKGGKMFSYFFDHQSSINYWPAWMGVLHGYEIEFVFGMPLNVTWGYTKTEVNMTRKFMKHWANFARTGNPGIDGAAWPLFTPDHQEYVTLNSHLPENRSMMKTKECYLWNKVMSGIQKVSEDLQACLNANGVMLHYDCTILIISLFFMIILLDIGDSNNVFSI
ncbi:acetylcholinesterase-like isoform X2 [Corythoichthys intestinalis]|uniref:acetylcholinesterase-like isoform X2 n=1 Tax=Corythoichthys intestinalis TaxID=161448 RepID=UPI0025A65BBE|nr:acetylcholinesterase-like isoform X2 [Corythoichthys intestinalis]